MDPRDQARATGSCLLSAHFSAWVDAARTVDYPMHAMGKLWLTYAWSDNAQQDVDFVAQELRGAGVDVKLDRWTVGAGKRLWEQIDHSIRDPKECDGWAIYLTQSSLTSQPCLEELAYALDRALGTRGQAFPLIGISPGVSTRLSSRAPLGRASTSLRPTRIGRSG